MPDDPTKSSKRVLEPHERISEVIFGLIMVLTFTGSLSVAEAGRFCPSAVGTGNGATTPAWSSG
jgi:hypothetical protein